MSPCFALLGGFAIAARLATCYGNITRTRNVSEYMLVLVLCQYSSLYVTNAHDYTIGVGLYIMQVQSGLTFLHRAKPME